VGTAAGCLRGKSVTCVPPTWGLRGSDFYSARGCGAGRPAATSTAARPSRLPRRDALLPRGLPAGSGRAEAWSGSRPLGLPAAAAASHQHLLPALPF